LAPPSCKSPSNAARFASASTRFSRCQTRCITPSNLDGLFCATCHYPAVYTFILVSQAAPCADLRGILLASLQLVESQRRLNDRTNPPHLPLPSPITRSPRSRRRSRRGGRRRSSSTSSTSTSSRQAPASAAPVSVQWRGPIYKSEKAKGEQRALGAPRAPFVHLFRLDGRRARNQSFH
jgi:hypothetical protein